MPGVCPRCDKNVYFAEEVFLDLINMEILFHISILGEGVGKVLPQDVLQVYWLRVDNPSIYLVNLPNKSLDMCVKGWKYFSGIIGWGVVKPSKYILYATLFFNWTSLQEDVGLWFNNWARQSDVLQRLLQVPKAKSSKVFNVLRPGKLNWKRNKFS